MGKATVVLLILFSFWPFLMPWFWSSFFLEGYVFWVFFQFFPIDMHWTFIDQVNLFFFLEILQKLRVLVLWFLCVIASVIHFYRSIFWWELTMITWDANDQNLVLSKMNGSFSMCFCTRVPSPAPFPHSKLFLLKWRSTWLLMTPVFIKIEAK